MEYIDTEGSKFFLIRAHSGSPMIAAALCQFVDTALDDSRVLVWYSRVPSPSNIADFPSRCIGRPWLTQSAMATPDHVARALRDVERVTSVMCG